MNYRKKDTVMGKQKKKKKSENFEWENFEKEAIARLKKGEEFGGKDGILAP